MVSRKSTIKMLSVKEKQCSCEQSDDQKLSVADELSGLEVR
ncbi:unnamed protein product [Haemonchus placei]|uniref:Transposase n=1 Tax=Haemonchus placei TaxID=6290 RepID=A0A0N4WPI9_HAEPC|nr:unnamed protein product [Haemonchus placei]